MRRHFLTPALAAMAALTTLAAAGCGDEGSSASGEPAIVVTTTILGDVVSNLVGEEAEVEVLMPPNAAPHEFSTSARQATAMREADVIVTNGGGFEEGMDDAIAAAEDDGVTVFAAFDSVDQLDDDPHFFTDPARMIEATRALAEFLPGQVPALDNEAFRRQADSYLAELEALDADVEATLAPVPPERRRLVTNHEVFSYFADRYGFAVIGTAIPAVTTQAEPSAGELADLAAAVAAAGVPAIFADTSSPDDLADALAREVGDVEVVELYSESLDEPGSAGGTYAGMMRTNAQRIAEALA
jgi:zinc/manganese transport system substrate-binding protein